MKNDNKPVRILDIKTGAWKPFLTLCDVTIDSQGNIYGTGGWDSNAILRFDPEGQPLPFEATKTNKLDTGPWYASGVDFARRGQCVDRQGNIYFIRSHKSAPEAGIGARVDVFGPDGRKKQAGFIDGLGYGDCGIGIDARGNVYLGMSIKPAA